MGRGRVVALRSVAVVSLVFMSIFSFSTAGGAASCPGGPWTLFEELEGNGDNNYVRLYTNDDRSVVRVSWRLSANTIDGGVDEWVFMGGIADSYRIDDGSPVYDALIDSPDQTNPCTKLVTGGPGSHITISIDAGAMAVHSANNHGCTETKTIETGAEVRAKISITDPSVEGVVSKRLGQEHSCQESASIWFDSESLVRSTFDSQVPQKESGPGCYDDLPWSLLKCFN